MALATVQDCKDYLRIQGTAEDTMLDVWLTQAIAQVETFLRRPITATLRTFVLERPSQAVYGAPGRLFVPSYPIAIADSTASTADLVLVNGDGDTLIEDTDYRLNLRTGEIAGLVDGAEDSGFATFPYTVTAYVGLSALDEYAERIEPVLNAAILDIVADRYQRRNPVASSETTGGGVSTSYTSTGLPARVVDLLTPYRMARAL